ncbi:cyclophilin-like fold protein [Streptomyces sp900116325]|uniref:cyclophilin-like fold protein n=1 Tax=Streptomyces sp. 900116325 TaxID=3154295 RepID=UPI0033A9D5E7
MRIRLTAGETVLNATLGDNTTARDFASLLPLTLQMNDLLRREKFGHLPRSLTAGGAARSSSPNASTSRLCRPSRPAPRS